MIQGQVVDGRFECRGTTSRPEPGEAWVAWDGDREVVLRLVSGTVTDELERAAFSRAAAAAMKMTGHSVEKTVHAGFVDNSRPYVVTEKTSGRSLAEELSAGQAFDVPRSLEIAIAVAESLSEAMQYNICHGHLSPAVITLAAGSRKGKRKATRNPVKILGFSPWEAVPTATVFNRDAVAPEVLDGSIPDIRSDCWSLGNILYRMLTGSTPEKEAARQSGKRVSRFPAPSSVRPEAGIPPGLDILILRLLETDPERRMASPSQLAGHLKALASGDGTTDIPAPDDAVPASIPVAANITQENDLDEGISFASGKRVRTTSMRATGVTGGGGAELAVDPAAASPAVLTPDERAAARTRQKATQAGALATPASTGLEKRSGGMSTILVVLLVGFFVLAAISVTGWFVLRYQDRQLELARGREAGGANITTPIQPATPGGAMPEAVAPVAQPAPTTPIATPPTVVATPEAAVAQNPAAPIAAPALTGTPAPDIASAPATVTHPTIASKPATTAPKTASTKPVPPTDQNTVVKPESVSTEPVTTKTATVRPTSVAKKPTGAAKSKSATTGTKVLNWDDGLDDGVIETSPTPKPAGSTAPKTDSTTKPALQWDE